MIATMGHSTRPLKEFFNILKAHNIRMLIDVRTVPRSRFNPQFNQSTFSKNLKKKGIIYSHSSELGGFRHTSKKSINTAWRNLSFRGYADYMQTRPFIHAIRNLIKTAKGKNIVLMCAEGNPFRCHRSLIADALMARKIQVWEISSATSKKKHRITPFAKIKGVKVTYPLPITKKYK